MDTNGNFVSAKIPLSYQKCKQDGKLPGCLVMDDQLDEQCSQGRKGNAYIAMLQKSNTISKIRVYVIIATWDESYMAKT